VPRAALVTAGRILTYRDKPAEVFYSASCGGRSEAAATVWPGTSLPYLTSVPDDVHDDDPEWTLDLTLDQIHDVLRFNGFDGTRITDIEVEGRSSSGRVARLRVKGLRPDRIDGAAFRMAMGPTRVRSTAFSLKRTATGVRLTGKGYGHGVGMCVIGAGRRARRGESSDEILAKYYPGLKIASLDGVALPVIETAAAKPKSVTMPPPAGASGIVVRVAKGSPITADELQRQAVRAYGSLAAQLGTSVAPITLEVHDSINRFRDVTGRPWWVSSVVQDTSIDLAPVSVLEQRGGVEQAIRQAIAEVFVTPTLAQRPAWVRIGAARYFATQPGGSSRQSARDDRRLKCPSDAELTLAISAAAQRDADARAEACFARAFARTNDWRAVR
jgi:hypothetical protein